MPTSPAIIIDECVGPESDLWRQFINAVAHDSNARVFLADSHPGMPDNELLAKVLKPGMILVTADCQLHQQAVKQGVRSYTLNEFGQMTRKPLVGIKNKAFKPPLPGGVRDNYQSQLNELTLAITNELPEKTLRRYRTARRRIRSHFGSAQAIGQLSLTVGSLHHRSEMLCGFEINIGGGNGIKGLRATEGYARYEINSPHNALAMIHGMREIFLLHLNGKHTEAFIIGDDSFNAAKMPDLSPVDTYDRAMQKMMDAIPKLRINPCRKGLFHDRMIKRLTSLQRKGSNEIRDIDFGELASRILNSRPVPLIGHA